MLHSMRIRYALKSKKIFPIFNMGFFEKLEIIIKNSEKQKEGY